MLRWLLRFLIPRQKRGAMFAAALAAAAVLQAGRLVEAPAGKRRSQRHCSCNKIFRSLPTGHPGYFQQTLSDLTSLSMDSAAKSAGTKIGSGRLARVAVPILHD